MCIRNIFISTCACRSTFVYTFEINTKRAIVGMAYENSNVFIYVYMNMCLHMYVWFFKFTSSHTGVTYTYIEMNMHTFIHIKL